MQKHTLHKVVRKSVQVNTVTAWEELLNTSLLTFRVTFALRVSYMNVQLNTLSIRLPTFTYINTYC